MTPGNANAKQPPISQCDRDRFVDVMRLAIALNGSFFNTQRMILQYVLKAYLDKSTRKRGQKTHKVSQGKLSEWASSKTLLVRKYNEVRRSCSRIVGAH